MEAPPPAKSPRRQEPTRAAHQVANERIAADKRKLAAPSETESDEENVEPYKRRRFERPSDEEEESEADPTTGAETTGAESAPDEAQGAVAETSRSGGRATAPLTTARSRAGEAGGNVASLLVVPRTSTSSAAPAAPVLARPIFKKDTPDSGEAPPQSGKPE